MGSDEERHPQQGRANCIFVRWATNRGEAMGIRSRQVVGVFISKIQIMVDHQRADKHIIANTVRAEELPIYPWSRNQREIRQERYPEEAPKNARGPQWWGRYWSLEA